MGKKLSVGRRIGKVLDEKETFLMSMMLLAHMHSDGKYTNITELIYLFDNYSGFKQFIKFYEGQTIQVPTVLEVKKALRLLDLFQKVYIDNRDFDEYYKKLKIYELGVTKTECKEEFELFREHIDKEGVNVIRKLRKVGRK